MEHGLKDILLKNKAVVYVYKEGRNRKSPVRLGNDGWAVKGTKTLVGQFYLR